MNQPIQKVSLSKRYGPEFLTYAYSQVRKVKAFEEKKLHMELFGELSENERKLNFRRFADLKQFHRILTLDKKEEFSSLCPEEKLNLEKQMKAHDQNVITKKRRMKEIALERENWLIFSADEMRLRRNWVHINNFSQS